MHRNSKESIRNVIFLNIFALTIFILYMLIINGKFDVKIHYIKCYLNANLDILKIVAVE